MIDAGVVAQLYASGFLAEVFVPNVPTHALHWQVIRRNQIVRQQSRQDGERCSDPIFCGAT